MYFLLGGNVTSETVKCVQKLPNDLSECQGIIVVCQNTSKETRSLLQQIPSTIPKTLVDMKNSNVNLVSIASEFDCSCFATHDIDIPLKNLQEFNGNPVLYLYSLVQGC